MTFLPRSGDCSILVLPGCLPSSTCGWVELVVLPYFWNRGGGLTYFDRVEGRIWRGRLVNCGGLCVLVGENGWRMAAY